jgi:hypothetical protein
MFECTKKQFKNQTKTDFILGFWVKIILLNKKISPSVRKGLVVAERGIEPLTSGL